LRIEYRRQGDTVGIRVPQVLDPSDGAYTWVSGVQGGTIYEARVLPVTRPERAVSWTAWASTASNTAAQVVEVAALATSVPPNTITAEMLAETERFLLGLLVAGEEVQGSVAERISVVAAELGTMASLAHDAMTAANAAGGAVQTLRTEITNAQYARASDMALISARLQPGGDFAVFKSETEAAIGPIETALGNKNHVFRQAAAPVATAVGDIWIETDNSNKLYVATTIGTAGWVAADDQRIGTLVTNTNTLTTRLNGVLTTATDQTTVLESKPRGAFEQREADVPTG
jgi:hypothetical protein